MAHPRRSTLSSAALLASITLLAANFSGAVAMALNPSRETDGGSDETTVIAADTRFASFELRHPAGEPTAPEV